MSRSRHRPLVKLTRPSFKAREKSALPSNRVQTHQKIRRTTIASAMPTGSLTHNSPLSSTASRPKATKNDIMLSEDDVRLVDHATISVVTTYDQSSSEYGRLYKIARVSNLWA